MFGQDEGITTSIEEDFTASNAQYLLKVTTVDCFQLTFLQNEQRGIGLFDSAFSERGECRSLLPLLGIFRRKY